MESRAMAIFGDVTADILVSAKFYCAVDYVSPFNNMSSRVDISMLFVIQYNDLIFQPIGAREVVRGS
jgi:hypothetical protein